MKTVIVTGASRGIGAAICRSLRAKGIRVIGVARSQSALQALSQEKIGGGPMEFVVGDVADPQVAQSAVKLASASGHCLNALLLNAGALDPVAKLADVDPDQFKRAFDVNVFSAIPWVQAALPALRSAHGRIILTSSGVATVGYAGFASYCASKAAINMILEVLALEEPDVVTLAVAPGVVETQMSDSFLEQGRSLMSPTQLAYMENLAKRGLKMQPADVAGAYAKLALNAPKSQSGKFVDWDAAWIRELPDV